MARTRSLNVRDFVYGMRLFFAAALTLACNLPRSRAHPITRGAHESSLDPREARTLVAAASLRSAPANPTRASETCQVALSLIDAETKQTMDGLVRVTREDGGVVPLAGLVNRGIKLRNNHPAKDWYALTETATLSLPRTRLIIEAFAGLHTELTRVTVDLSGQTADRIEIPLKTFFNASQHGWFAGNTHLHLNSLTREQADEYLRILPRADGLDLVFVSYLERVKADLTYITNSYSREELEGLGNARLHFGNGEEHRHNFERNSEGYGHVMMLNIRRLVRPVSIGQMITGTGPDWPPLRPGIEQARRDGATIIWCHNALGYEDVPNWLGGLIAAQNIFDGGSQGSYADTFYRYLDIGMMVPFSTGTDWFIYDFSRVYARLTDAPTVPNWLAALTAGRTFITNGPLLDLRLGSNVIGDTVSLTHPGKLPVSGSARGRHDFGGLELVHDGKVVHRVATRAVDGHFEATLEFSLPINESGWVALRIPGGSLDSTGAVVLPPNIPVRANGPRNEMGEVLFAHTSPVYVEMAGRKIFRKAAAETLIAEMEAALKAIPAKAHFDRDEQREDV
jgi:hypothetical protein